jgi:hypothetical protein
MLQKFILLTQSLFAFLLILPGVILPHQRSTAIYLQAVSTRTMSTRAMSTAASRPRDGYGIYESCDPHFAIVCYDRLNYIAVGGFSEIMDYSAFSSDTTIYDVVAYATYANLIGMKIIWPVDDFIYSDNNATNVLSQYPTLAQSINSSGLCSHPVNTNYWLVACTTIITTNHPGTWGYYIGDELPASAEPKARHVVDAILDWNKNAPRLFMAGDTDGHPNGSVLNAYARYYRDGSYGVADANVIAQDYYPIGTVQQSNAAAHTGQVAVSLSSFAKKYKISYGLALQAHSLSEYKTTYPWCKSPAVCPYPTAAQEQSMLSAVLAEGQPRIVMWYSYFDLLNSNNYMQHWTDLTGVVGGVPALPTGITPIQGPCLLAVSAAHCVSGQDAHTQL